jgi:hypothetical protein
VPAPFAAATPTTSHTVKISAELTGTDTKPPSCSGGVCTIKNHATGAVTPYGNVTFTTMIIAAGNQPPCGTGS